MIDLKRDPTPLRPPGTPAFVAKVAFWCGALSGAVGACCGATGLARTAYQAAPWEQALLLAWTFGVYGVLGGLPVAVVINAVRRRARRRKSAQDEPPLEG